MDDSITLDVSLPDVIGSFGPDYLSGSQYYANGTVQLTISTMSDSGSGIFGYAITTSATPPSTGTYTISSGGPFTVPVSGYLSSSSFATLYCHVRDNVGYIRTIASAHAMRLDTTPPVLSYIMYSGQPYYSGDSIYTKLSSVSVTVSATDTGGSGVKEYSRDSGATWSTTLSTLSSGSSDIVARDNAGNISNLLALSVVQDIVPPQLDSFSYTAPVLSFIPTDTDALYSWSIAETAATYTIDQTYTGLAYADKQSVTSISSGALQSCNDSLLNTFATANCFSYVRMRLTDMAGNTTDVYFKRLLTGSTYTWTKL